MANPQDLLKIIDSELQSAFKLAVQASEQTGTHKQGTEIGLAGKATTIAHLIDKLIDAKIQAAKL